MNKTNLTILFFTMVVIMLGFGIIIPIMPFFIEQYGATGSDLGMLMAVFGIMQFLFAPIWGRLSDRYGRKRLLIVGALGNGLAHLIFGFATGLPLMFVSRILAGIFSSATFPTALAYISDSTDEQGRGGGMGIIGASMGVGMVLGPGIGGWLGGSNTSTPFFLASGLSVIAALLILMILPESLPEEKREKSLTLRGPQLGLMWRSLFGPIGFLLILAFLVNFGLANFEGIFGLYAKHRYAYGPGQVGTIMTVMGLVSAIVQGFVTGPANRKLGEERLIKLSLLAGSLGFVLMLLAQGFTVVMLMVGFFILSITMLRPSLASLISKRAIGGQGAAMGLSSSFESMGRVVGPLWAGTLFDININLPYTSAAVILLIVFVISMLLLKRMPARQAVQIAGPAGE
jgi:DHA1 family multidrug resistance protein-like MFS transporter